MTSVATFASGTPVAFETNGTVRDARGFASRIHTLSSFTAICTFRMPFTPSARASVRVASSARSRSWSVSVDGGMTQEESPECTPTSSMCSITAPMNTSPVPSAMASTSISIAPSRNRSMRTGCSGDAAAAVFTNPLSSSSP